MLVEAPVGYFKHYSPSYIHMKWSRLKIYTLRIKLTAAGLLTLSNATNVTRVIMRIYMKKTLQKINNSGGHLNK